MRVQPPDPAPREYPPAVHLLRRSARGSAAAPGVTTVDDIIAWLLGDAIGDNDLLTLFESLVWRLVAAGLPLDRASLHVGTLHPQMIGLTWNWELADAICDEVRVGEASLGTDAYRRNPLFRVIEHGETVRAMTDDADTVARYPLVAALAAQGYTEYTASPLGGGTVFHNAATVATRQVGGFTPAQRADLNRILKVFGLHVERHVIQRIAGNVLDTYLGAAAGARVLGGSIRRGSGEPIHAVVWASDLRGFTDLADRLDGPDMIALLNAYFERMAGAVIDHGGEVLKFIGDGLLAVFPFGAFAVETAAAEASLAAAKQAIAYLDVLNADEGGPLSGIEGWRPLRTGIALHEGEVFFGNVGAPERLDFTVIGRAVNVAARVEALTKVLGRPILVTAPVAARLARPLESFGAHDLRGVAEQVEIFAPAPGDADRR